MVRLEHDLMAKNDTVAADNRRWLTGHEVFAVNLVSSPGSGKTTLLERTIAGLGGPVSVLEGDQETEVDAARIRAAGAAALQINTGTGCHLDAEMVRRGLATLASEPGTVLFVENVGNLVCPALFDLGEQQRVVVLSVTEGEDKPLKYPHMFSSSDLVLLNKVDLLPYVDFDTDTFRSHLHAVRPGARVLPVSATGGDGLEEWYSWLRNGRSHARSTAVAR